MNPQRASMFATGGRRAPIPVLMYHDLAETLAGTTDPHGPYILPAATFREQMGLIAASGLKGVSLARLLDRNEGEASDRARPCVITFDDGHGSNHLLALPRLLEAGFRATFFVTAGWVGRSPYMTWEQIKDLATAGMEIGSHSMTHRPPASLRRSELLAEMADSKRLLEDRLGRPIVSASSPTGYFNPAMIPVAREAGYRALCVGRIALWKDPADAYGIPRLPVKSRTGSEEFRRMILGDRRLLATMRARQIVLGRMKAALGVEGYGRVRRALFRILGGGNRRG